MAEDITRLPKWAQRKIEYLERQVTGLQVLVDETRNSESDTNVKVSRFGPMLLDHGDADWGLPKNANIDFYLESDKFGRKPRIEVRHLRSEPGWIDVSASNGLLLIKPSAGNVVRIGVEDW